MAPTARSITIDQDRLEADILDLADRSANLGLSDLGEHTEGLNFSQWDLNTVRRKLDELTNADGRMAHDAKSALDRLRELA